jgi:hypothetical protein
MTMLAGTVSALDVDVRLTVRGCATPAPPPTGESWARVTVQVVESFGPRRLGLQTSEDRTEVMRFTLVLAELLL